MISNLVTLAKKQIASVNIQTGYLNGNKTNVYFTADPSPGRPGGPRGPTSPGGP